MEGLGTSRGSKYDCLLFDVDDTLYPSSTGLNQVCAKNIQDYMVQYLKIEATEVPRMCLELYKEYGTTMAGLKALGYEFDKDEFHAFVHGRLPYERLKPDTSLNNLLLSLPQRKIIFTNADKAHAARVLNRLGLEGCFQGIICFETLNPHFQPNNHDNTQLSHSQILCKPSLDAIQAAIQIAHIDPNKTIFFDDSAPNLASGKVAGLNTVIVGSPKVVTGADIALESIHNMKEALPELWINEQDQVQQIVHSSAVEALVLA